MERAYCSASACRHLPAFLCIIMLVLSGLTIDGVMSCNMNTKEVGVCLHVYLERDFLSLEGIVYPTKRRRPYSRLQQLPPLLPELDEGDLNITAHDEGDVISQGLHQGHREIYQKKDRRNISKRSYEAGRYSHVDAYGQHGWVEGPELEDYCRRIGSVVTCFEEVLVECNTAYDFFRYRHLLHSLEKVYKYLCHTPDDRLNKFLPFLKVINCAETARLNERSCHRPNVTVNVWNQILRMELGPELCNSLNTQRSCLLENRYVRSECGEDVKEELYRNVTAIFLATWCRLPMPPHLLPYVSSTSSQRVTGPFVIILIVFHTLYWLKNK